MKNRNTLLKEERQEQQAFNVMKSELKSIQRKKSYIREENSRKKREPVNDAMSQSTSEQPSMSEQPPSKQTTQTDVAVSQQSKTETSLHQCLQLGGFSGQQFWDLTLFEQGVVIGCMNEAYENLEKSVLVLGMRTRMEEFRDCLYPGKIPSGMTNAQAWDDIMNSDDQKFLSHPLVPHFRKTVLAVEGMTTDIFLLIVRELYGPLFSMLATHKIGFLAGKVPTTLEDIQQMFKTIGIIPDKRRVIVVQKLMMPWKLPPTTISTTKVTHPTDSAKYFDVKQKSKEITHPTHSTRYFDGKQNNKGNRKHRNNRGRNNSG